MNIRFSTISILFLFALTSCGYFYSGQWEDDKKNWSRAYNQQLPDTIHVIHSWYWRSPHFTLEQALYFEIEYNETIHHNFLKDSTVMILPQTDTNNISFFNDKPTWFIPKPYKNYTIWKGKRDSFDNFILFLDKDNRHIYWTDYQL